MRSSLLTPGPAVVVHVQLAGRLAVAAVVLVVGGRTPRRGAGGDIRPAPRAVRAVDRFLMG